MTDFVTAEWLADRLDDDAVRVVDVRDAWEYDGIGHVPGAVNVPFDSFRADEHAAERSDGDESGGGGSEGMLPPHDEFEGLLSDAGIANGDEIVAYDDTHGVFAARFLVTAELLGHDPANLHLLDGDFSAWQLEFETSSEPPDVATTDYVVDPPESTPLVGPEEVAAATDRGAVLVDTREDWEYEEGHIPGAVQLDWRELVDEETRGLKSIEAVRSILEERGITPDREVVLYCNTARRISHTYVVLRHLGYDDVAFYEGSLTEWDRQGRPIESAE